MQMRIGAPVRYRLQPVGLNFSVRKLKPHRLKPVPTETRFLHCAAEPESSIFLHAQAFHFRVSLAGRRDRAGADLETARPSGGRCPRARRRPVASRARISGHGRRAHFRIRGFRRALDAAGARERTARRRDHGDCRGSARFAGIVRVVLDARLGRGRRSIPQRGRRQDLERGGACRAGRARPGHGAVRSRCAGGRNAGRRVPLARCREDRGSAFLPSITRNSAIWIRSPSIPAIRGIIYAGTFHLPWKTTDGGRTWRPIHDGMIDDSDVMSLLIDGPHPERLYASACSGIYRSDDGAGAVEKNPGHSVHRAPHLRHRRGSRERRSRVSRRLRKDCGRRTTPEKTGGEPRPSPGW